jgi:DNA-binding response OmpR family regulator
MPAPTCTDPSCCPSRPAARIELGDLVIDFDRIEARIGGRRVSLRPQEFRLLGYLALHPNKIHAHDQIVPLIFGAEVDQLRGGTGAIRTLICRTRNKLVPGPQTPVIESRYGLGYGLMTATA